MTQEPRKLPRFAGKVIEMMKTDPQLQALMPKREVYQALMDPKLSYWQVIDAALSGYAQRPALGKRAYNIVVDPLRLRAQGISLSALRNAVRASNSMRSE